MTCIILTLMCSTGRVEVNYSIVSIQVGNLKHLVLFSMCSDVSFWKKRKFSLFSSMNTSQMKLQLIEAVIALDERYYNA